MTSYIREQILPRLGEIESELPSRVEPKARVERFESYFVRASTRHREGGGCDKC